MSLIQKFFYAIGLIAICFSSSQAVIFLMRDVSWTGGIDLDNDGYLETRKMLIDVDYTTCDGKYGVYAYVYYRLDGDPLWTWYDTDYFYIYCSDTDPDTMPIGYPNPKELPLGIYDFRIEIYTGSTLQFTYDNFDDPDLNNQQFEAGGLNHPPVITSPLEVTAVVNKLLTYTGTATDQDGHTIFITYRHWPSWTTWIAPDLFGTPEDTGDTSFMIVAYDGALKDSAVVTVHVINHNPQITSPTQVTAIPAGPFGYRAAAADPDSQSLYFIFSNLPSWLSQPQYTFDSVAGIVPAQAQDTFFVLTASDGHLSTTDTVFIQILRNPSILSTDPMRSLAITSVPNPFMGSAVISFFLEQAQFIRITLFDFQGKELKVLFSGRSAAAAYSIPLEGAGLSAGIYYYKIQTEKNFWMKPILLMR